VTSITEVQSASTRCLPVCGAPGECYYNTLFRLWVFFTVKCVTARILCTVCVFDGRAPLSSIRLPLCQILILSRPPLLN